MKFAVGYQLDQGEERPFSDIVKKYKEDISEVYFPWLDSQSGRSSLTNRRGAVDWNGKDKLISDLRLFKDLGFKLDLLLNGNCYGKYAMSQYLQNNIYSILDYLEDEVGGADIVTTASPAIAHMIKLRYPNMDVRASVNMRIGTVKGIQYVSHLFDSFYIQREYNRDFERIEELQEWAKENNKEMLMLANSGCMNFCSGQTFHDNTVSHGSEIEEIKNIENWNPHMCWNYLTDSGNWLTLLQNSWVRPEDLHHYQQYFSTVKLATRMHALPGMVINAYISRRFFGNLLDLFEPGYGPALAPYVIDNTKFPMDWFEVTSKCDKKCHQCNYCTEVMEQVLINTEAF
ncbi:MAG: hypothetical protein GX783_10690 [Clostridiales bacterium]|nr:hypothetical protein [Clostridiales bacterium]